MSNETKVIATVTDEEISIFKSNGIIDSNGADTYFLPIGLRHIEDDKYEVVQIKDLPDRIKAYLLESLYA